VTRRFLAALAALAVFAVASLIWVQPAQAAPKGMCSVEEWTNPANFLSCTQRTKEAAADRIGCVRAPTPGSPTSGMPGWFTAQPDTALRSGVIGQYSMYGVGGYGLDTYDIGCLGAVKHPDLTLQNTVASGGFTIAASIMGAANGLREIAYDPGSMWGWADPYLEAATKAVFEAIFAPIGAIFIALVGLYLLWRAKQGDLSQTIKIAAWAVFLTVAVTALVRWPVASAHAADEIAGTGLAAVHAVLGPGPQDIPAAECALGGEACKDNRTVAVRSSDVATEAVLYRPWLRALLGSSETTTAKKYGPALFDATTMSWGEAARAEQSPELRTQLITQKASTWDTIAEQIRVEDPLAYEHMQGVHGSDRAGAGMVAVFSALFFAAFDMAVSLMILFGFLIFRVAIILLPLLATFGVFMPASAGVRRVLNMTVEAGVNIVVFGAAGGIYLVIVDGIYRSALPGPAQLAAVALMAVAGFYLLRPDRHLVQTATGRTGSKETPLGKLINKVKLSPTPDSGDSGPRPGASDPRPRPEAATTAGRAAGAKAGAAAASAAGHPVVATVVETFGSRPRPETGQSQPGKVRTAVTAAAPVVATAAGGPAAGAATAATVSKPRPRPETRS
jgi:hypothetical protein